jgi:transposase-like protein
MLKRGAVEQGAREHAAIFRASSVSDGSWWCQARPSAAWRRLMKTPLGESVGGTRLIEQLPHPNTKRWVVRRKAAVVAAVRSGGVTLEEACRVYQLSKEELLSWDRAFELHGLAGLRVTRIQQYRRSPPEDAPLRLTETAGRDLTYGRATE